MIIDWLPRFILGHAGFDLSWPKKDPMKTIVTFCADFCVDCAPAVSILITIAVMLVITVYALSGSTHPHIQSENESH